MGRLEQAMFWVGAAVFVALAWYVIFSALFRVLELGIRYNSGSP